MLSGCADGLPSKVAEVDRECLEKRTQHMQATIPEGNRQHTAAGLFTDAALIGAAWPFNVTADMGPELARAVHVWQVGAEECPYPTLPYPNTICCSLQSGKQSRPLFRR